VSIQITKKGTAALTFQVAALWSREQTGRGMQNKKNKVDQPDD
jgi:hypothetical protein